MREQRKKKTRNTVVEGTARGKGGELASEKNRRRGLSAKRLSRKSSQYKESEMREQRKKKTRNTRL